MGQLHLVLDLKYDRNERYGLIGGNMYLTKFIIILY